LEGDARSTFRDPLLGWVVALPLGLALLLRVLVPAIEEALRARGGADLAPYHALIVSGYLLTAPGIVGMVIGFLLLDERDTRTLDAVRVTPLSLEWYLVYRVALPLALGTAATLVGYPIVGLAPLPLGDLVAIAGLGGLSAPLLTLVLATAAPNKVAGLAVVKVVNAVNLFPVVAFFVPMPWQLFAGALPGYWPMRALWSAAAGDAYGVIFAVGVLVNVLYLGVFARLFARRLRR
jgi:fluoroquinolone transport system permease protein